MRMHKARDAGGEGDFSWDLEYLISDIDNPKYQLLSRHISFKTKDIGEAKERALAFLKQIFRNIKFTKSKLIIVIIFPCGQNANVNEIIWLKHKYCNRSILQATDSTKVFVQGYGPKALKQLGEF